MMDSDRSSRPRRIAELGGIFQRAVIFEKRVPFEMGFSARLSTFSLCAIPV